MLKQTENNPNVYNEMYLHDDETFEDPNRSAYLPVFRAVIDDVRRRGLGAVIEVGCGSGTLARMLIDELQLDYVGFDFAEEGIRKAKAMAPSRATFFTGDATDPSSYRFNYDGIICIEVLEHILNDRAVISQWRPGAHCICSVPNFEYETHVRRFKHEHEIFSRYSDLIDIDSIIRIRRPIWANGLTFWQYLRRLRWNLDKPRYIIGLLGLNSFDNYAGWFLFSGRRRSGKVGRV